jgi:hypothetical protein
MDWSGLRKGFYLYQVVVADVPTKYFDKRSKCSEMKDNLPNLITVTRDSTTRCFQLSERML